MDPCSSTVVRSWCRGSSTKPKVIGAKGMRSVRDGTSVAGHTPHICQKKGGSGVRFALPTEKPSIVQSLRVECGILGQR